MPADVYYQLRAHLDLMPVAFPASESGVEIEILERFFSEVEAEAALCLSMLPEPAERIHGRMRMKNRTVSLEELRIILDGLVERKVINSALLRRRGKVKKGYGKLPFAIGLYEFQVDRLTRGFEEEAASYMDEVYMESFTNEHPRQMRTIPINETVLPERNISRYDRIREVINASEGPFVLQNCVCRQGRELVGEQCRQTELKETCLALGPAARGVLKEGRGTRLSREETIEFLKRAEKEGLVLQAQNTRDPVFICCCCSCCCAVLSRVKKLPNPGEVLQSIYIAGVDEDACIGCRICVDRCPMGALQPWASKSTMGVLQPAQKPRSPVTIEKRRCIGCGLCISSCPTGALKLEPAKKVKDPPRNAMEMYARMCIGRYGLLKGAFLLLKAGVGMRV